MTIPLPPPLSNLVARAQSLSLRFDRGYDGYEQDKAWQHHKADRDGGKEGKTTFLNHFAQTFNEHPQEPFNAFVKRRADALAPLKPVPRTSTSGLIVGIGRWNPVEVGFTFDRLSGCPFLPGSSVKGLLRAAAELVASGDLQGDRQFWQREGVIARIFGEGAEDAEAKRATFSFYDAFPTKWPKLEVDVMTPHHSKYYDGANPTAPDWDEPVPVHFLRIGAGTPFAFWFGPRAEAGTNEGDRQALESLLTTALDWLGAGAKTSSGYGWFDGAAHPAPAGQMPPPPPEAIVWTAAVIEWVPGSGTIRALHEKASAESRDQQIIQSLPAHVLTQLKVKRMRLPATVHVRQMGAQYFAIVKIEPVG
jgi:CRISPR type III-B/RAMP module RAMP protein Cmr6